MLRDALTYLRSLASAEMDVSEFMELLRVVGVRTITDRDPRVRSMLQTVNFSGLCRFLTQFFDGSEWHSRFFEKSPQSVQMETI